MSTRQRNNVNELGADGARVLLLAHGFGCDQNLWRPVVDRLASQFRIVLMDHVGSGASDPAAWDPQKYSTLSGYAADVLGVLDELDLHDVVYVGHSVASMIGALAAITDSSRIAKLVMITPSPRYIDDGDYHGGFTEADIDELLESLESNYLGWSHAMAPVIMGNPDRPDLHDTLEASFCRTDPACARVFARTTFRSDNRADLPNVPVPTLVIDCAHDAIAPRAVGAYVADRIPDGHLLTLDAMGHCPHASDPDATAAAIAEFASSP
jgi:sigma-B regulation protein RsbQ